MLVCQSSILHELNHKEHVKVTQFSMPSNSKHKSHDLSHDYFHLKKSKVKEFPTQITPFKPVNSSAHFSPKYKINPSKERSQSTSPTTGVYYAGAKFSEPPSPTALPRPPVHWTKCAYTASGGTFSHSPKKTDECLHVSNQIILLNASA